MLAKKFCLPVRLWKQNKGKIIIKKGVFFTTKIKPNNSDISRFGIIIGLKNAKKSTRRNYLKRTAFDFIRLNNLHLRPGKDFLIIASPAIGRATKAEAEKELKLLLT